MQFVSKMQILCYHTVFPSYLFIYFIYNVEEGLILNMRKISPSFKRYQMAQHIIKVYQTTTDKMLVIAWVCKDALSHI